MACGRTNLVNVLNKAKCSGASKPFEIGWMGPFIEAFSECTQAIVLDERVLRKGNTMFRKKIVLYIPGPEHDVC